MTALKELKCEYLQFFMNPKLEALIGTFKLPKTPNDGLDFTKVTTEQYFAFRHAFVQERMYNETFMANTGS